MEAIAALPPCDVPPEPARRPHGRGGEILQRHEPEAACRRAVAEERDDDRGSAEPGGEAERHPAEGRTAAGQERQDAPERHVRDDRREPSDGLTYAVRPRPAEL